ncbi:Hypothetical protein FKW44_005925 [Caligus rogercresseyi]|uniref:Uncharacterized protein n=1 Tax=Caligus rogercresseyi TaxID=217165 RepID=A0A7T8KCM1_CALRO|nr:Hypothetical protein FKW44_005925 [Caligus rogercresseyi]
MSTITGRKSCLKFCFKMPAPRNVILDVFNCKPFHLEAFDSLKAIYRNKPSLRRVIQKVFKDLRDGGNGLDRESRIGSPGSKELRKTSMKSKAFLTMTTE